MPNQSSGVGPTGPGKSSGQSSGQGLDLENGPTKYVDRPANEGKHDDAADEPNEGFPKDPGEPETTPARR
jgi:hypothetical protein